MLRRFIPLSKSLFSKQTRSFAFSSSKMLYSGMESNLYHENTEDNTEDTIFDFTPESYVTIKKILTKYPSNQTRSAICPLLDIAQRQMGGWIPLAAMKKIAEICQVPPRDVFECATFYIMFNRKKVGKYHVQICITTPCMLCGIDDIHHAIEKHLGIHLGETTPDGLFTLGEMECMGACVNAPMMVVSDYSNPPNFTYDFYEDLTIEKTIGILEAFKRGEKPAHGPQNGRKNSLGIQGKTSLFTEPPGPFCRDLTDPPKPDAQPVAK